MARKSKLSEKDIVHLYEYLCQYESELKTAAGKFDINDPNVQKVISENRIYLDSCNQQAKRKISKHKYYVLYAHRSDNPLSKKDKAHHLLRHIRNSIAHGLINKESGNILRLTDLNQSGNMTMEGKIEFNVLKQLLSAIIQSKKHD